MNDKMKKIAAIAAALCLTSSVGVSLTACKKKPSKPPHEHEFSDEWSKDDKAHWHAAICGDTDEVEDYQFHTWDSGVLTTPATGSSDGEYTYTDRICGYTRSIPVEGGFSITVMDTNDRVLSGIKVTIGGANGEYSEEPVTDQNGKLKIKVDPSFNLTNAYAVIKSENFNSEKYYYVDESKAYFGDKLSLTLRLGVIDANKLNCVYGEWEIDTMPTETTEGYAHRQDSTGTEQNPEYIYLPVLNEKNYSLYSNTATCTTDGHVTYIKYINGTPVYVSIPSPMTGHSLTKVDGRPADCTHDGVLTHYICSTCGKVFADAEGTIEISISDTLIPADSHKYGKWTAEVLPTESGSGSISRTCGKCHGKETIPLPAYLLPSGAINPKYTVSNDTATLEQGGEGTYTYRYTSKNYLGEDVYDGTSFSFRGTTPKRIMQTHTIRVRNGVDDDAQAGITVSIFYIKADGTREYVHEAKTIMPSSFEGLSYGYITVSLINNVQYYATIKQENLPENGKIDSEYFGIDSVIYILNKGVQDGNTVDTPLPIKADTTLSLKANKETFYYFLTPYGGRGKYTVTATASDGSPVKIQLYFSTMHSPDGDPEYNTKEFELPGGEQFISFTTTTDADVHVTFERTGELEFGVFHIATILPHEVPSRTYIPKQALSHVQMTGDEVIVYNEDDGFYHISSPDGPIVYTTLNSMISEYDWAPVYVSGESYMYSNFDNENIVYDLTEVVRQYAAYDTYVPVTREIKDFLQRYTSFKVNLYDYIDYSAARKLITNKQQWLFLCYCASNNNLPGEGTRSSAYIVEDGEYELTIGANQTFYFIYSPDEKVMPYVSDEKLDIDVNIGTTGRTFKISNPLSTPSKFILGVSPMLEGKGTLRVPYLIKTDTKYSALGSTTTATYYSFTAKKTGTTIIEYTGENANINVRVGSKTITVYKESYNGTERFRFSTVAGESYNLAVTMPSGRLNFKVTELDDYYPESNGSGYVQAPYAIAEDGVYHEKLSPSQTEVSDRRYYKIMRTGKYAISSRDMVILNISDETSYELEELLVLEFTEGDIFWISSKEPEKSTIYELFINMHAYEEPSHYDTYSNPNNLQGTESSPYLLELTQKSVTYKVSAIENEKTYYSIGAVSYKVEIDCPGAMLVYNGVTYKASQNRPISVIMTNDKLDNLVRFYVTYDTAHYIPTDYAITITNILGTVEKPIDLDTYLLDTTVDYSANGSVFTYYSFTVSDDELYYIAPSVTNGVKLYVGTDLSVTPSDWELTTETTGNILTRLESGKRYYLAASNTNASVSSVKFYIARYIALNSNSALFETNGNNEKPTMFCLETGKTGIFTFSANNNSTALGLNESGANFDSVLIGKNKLTGLQYFEDVEYSANSPYYFFYVKSTSSASALFKVTYTSLEIAHGPGETSTVGENNGLNVNLSNASPDRKFYNVTVPTGIKVYVDGKQVDASQPVRLTSESKLRLVSDSEMPVTIDYSIVRTPTPALKGTGTASDPFKILYDDSYNPIANGVHTSPVGDKISFEAYYTYTALAEETITITTQYFDIVINMPDGSTKTVTTDYSTLRPQFHPVTFKLYTGEKITLVMKTSTLEVGNDAATNFVMEIE